MSFLRRDTYSFQGVPVLRKMLYTGILGPAVGKVIGDLQAKQRAVLHDDN